MKLIFKGGYVFEVRLSDCIVAFSDKKIVITWFDGGKKETPLSIFEGESWTIPFDLIEDFSL